MKTEQITLYSIDQLLYCPSTPDFLPSGKPEVMCDDMHKKVTARLCLALFYLAPDAKKPDSTYFRSLDAVEKFLLRLLDNEPIIWFGSGLSWTPTKLREMGYAAPDNSIEYMSLSNELATTRETYSNGAPQYELVFHRNMSINFTDETGKPGTPIQPPPYRVAFLVSTHVITVADRS